MNANFPPIDLNNYKDWNARTMRDLLSCLARKDCGPNQAKVAILANDWFKDAIVSPVGPLVPAPLINVGRIADGN